MSSKNTERRIRVRGGNVKWRALRLDTENYSWGIEVDAAPFKQWYLQHYGVDIGRKKKTAAAAKKEREEAEAITDEVKKSNHVLRKLEKRQQNRKLDLHIEEQFGSSRLLACISSRPGQCGRVGGYILGRQRAGILHEEAPEKEGEGSCRKFCYSEISSFPSECPFFYTRHLFITFEILLVLNF
ncbi:hypothetical protein PTKIN_Ptkin07bG0106700 [Pterospermum kingtungense]